jgi:transcriptional regulator with XRE-family HTH domain
VAADAAGDRRDDRAAGAVVAAVVAEEPWGARPRRLREARGLSRTEFAAACTRLGRRTERSDIVHYERDDYWPRVPTFAALARTLGVSMEELLYGEAEAARIARERRRAGRGEQ